MHEDFCSPHEGSGKWTFATLLGISVDDFPGFGPEATRHANVGALDGAALSQLLSVDQLEQMLMTLPLVHPLVRVVDKGKRVPVELFTVPSGREPDAVRYIDSSKLFRCFRDGGSIVVRDLHRYWKPLTQLSWDLSRELRCAVTVNAYLSPPNEQAFKPHFDYHDIVVIQLFGRKEWVEFDANAILPLDDNNWRVVRDSVNPALPSQNPQVVATNTLAPGDVLFVPRGGSHAVRSLDTVSLHLTLEIQRWTHYDVVQTLLGKVAASERLRESLCENRNVDVPPTILESADRLRQFAEDSDPDSVHWLLHRNSHRDLFETPLAIVSQYHHLQDFAIHTKAERLPNMIFSIRVEGARACLELAERTFAIPLCHAAALERAMSGEPVTAADIEGPGTNARQAVSLLRTLVGEGVMRLPDFTTESGGN